MALGVFVGQRPALAAAEGDRAVGIPVVYPEGVKAAAVAGADAFASLKAESVVGKLKVSFRRGEGTKDDEVRLWHSVGRPGGWQARRWVNVPMPLTGRDRVGKIPIDAPDAPVVYFVTVRSAAGARVSPMRVCEPRQLGVRKPSRAFWPFLAGFEDGFDGWKILASGRPEAALRPSADGYNGAVALSATIPPGKGAVVVGTTVARGWHVQWKGAVGIRFQVKSRSGAGRLQVTAMTDAFSSRQQTSELLNPVRLEQGWKQVDVFFTEFPGLRAHELDFLAFEFIGAEGEEFLLDDLRLLGDWASLRN